MNGRSEQLAGGVKTVVRAGMDGHPVVIDCGLEVTDVVLGTIISCFTCLAFRTEEDRRTRETLLVVVLATPRLLIGEEP